MSIKLNSSGLEQALTNLGSLLERDSEAKPVHLVVCGGSALIATQLIENREFTRDIDVLALIESSSGETLISARPLPDSLLRAARTTAKVMDLFEDWVNDGPTDLLTGGLPEGFVDRLVTRDYGLRLKISFIGRLDQIHFKVYAASDTGPGRHFVDLQGLKPTSEELQSAVRWIQATQDSSEGFAEMLRNMLRALDHDNVADNI